MTAAGHDSGAPDTRTTRRSFLRGAGLAGGTVLVVSAGGLSFRAYERGVLEAAEAVPRPRGVIGEGPGPRRSCRGRPGCQPARLSGVGVSHRGGSRRHLRRPQAFVGNPRPVRPRNVRGLGCALENLLQAAPAHGYRAELALLPTPGQPVHAARIDLRPGPRRRSALYRAIPEATPIAARTRPALPRKVLKQMTALAGGLPGARLHWFGGDATGPRSGLMVDAARTITRDERQSRDSFRLFRSSWDDIQKHKDGLTLDVQGLSALTTAVAKLLPVQTARAGTGSGSTRRAARTPRPPRPTASSPCPMRAPTRTGSWVGDCSSVFTSGPPTASRYTT